MSGGLRKIFRKPSLRASASSGEPGSVMAANREPASARPAASTRERKKRYCERVSSVVPDLLDTRKKVRSRRAPASAERIASGSVASSTSRIGAPGPGVMQRFSTSGARLDPPMPSRSTRVKPAPRTSAEKARSSAIRARSRPGSSSQPSRLRMTAAWAGSSFQREASRAKSRATASPFRRDSSVSR
jgi:hypothetical protein